MPEQEDDHAIKIRRVSLDEPLWDRGRIEGPRLRRRTDAAIRVNKCLQGCDALGTSIGSAAVLYGRALHWKEVVMSGGLHGAGLWIVRAALVLLIASAGVRYFGHTSASDRAANWILLASTAVGLAGIAVTAAERWRRRAPTRESKGDEAI